MIHLSTGRSYGAFEKLKQTNAINRLPLRGIVKKVEKNNTNPASWQ